MNFDERGQALAIGQRIRARRLELGLSQRQLSQPGVSYAYISRLEAGTRNPSVKALRLLAPRLNVSVEWLETGEEASRFARFDDAELRLFERALRSCEPERVGDLLTELRLERSGRHVP
jgi:transcriptional regulator with XRE-family HTH domain